MAELTPERLWPLLEEVLRAMGQTQLAPPDPGQRLAGAPRLAPARLGLPFTVQPADIDEPTTGYREPRTFVQAVSWLKAAAVAPTGADGVVLAADTIGWVDGQAILKPADEADARRILRHMGGRRS